MLPLPIRNIVMAVVDFEKQQCLAIETSMTASLQNTLIDLENILAAFQVYINRLNTTQADLLEDAKRTWMIDLETVDLIPGTSKEETLYAKILDLHAQVRSRHMESTMRKRSRVQTHVPVVDTTAVDARLALSKAYRQKAHNLTTNQMLERVSLPSVPETRPQDSAIECSIISEPAEASTEDLMSQANCMRAMATRLWYPHRKHILEILQKEDQDLRRIFFAKVYALKAHSVRPQTFQKDALQEEFSFAVNAFPCDRTMLKTCMTVTSDGAKLSHVRKLMEIKSDFATQFQMRMKQFESLFVEYTEATVVPTF